VVMRASSWGRIRLSRGPSSPAWAGVVAALTITLSPATDAARPGLPSVVAEACSAAQR
jgi:hypothetical protein